MERTNTEKMWMMGMGLVGFVLVLIGYFFFISPQRDKTDQVNGQVSTAQIANLGLQSRITLLNAQNAKLASYQEQLHVAQLALPATSGMPAFLRTLQSLSGTTSTTLTTLTVGSPTSLDGGQVVSSPSSTSSSSPSPSASGTAAAASDPGVYSIPITAVVTGSTHALSAFLTQLQSVQPRAVLITNVVLGASSPAATTTTKISPGRTTLALTMQAFVAPATAPASAPAPATASPSASPTAGS